MLCMILISIFDGTSCNDSYFYNGVDFKMIVSRSALLPIIISSAAVQHICQSQDVEDSDHKMCCQGCAKVCSSIKWIALIDCS